MANAFVERLDVDGFLAAFEGREGRWELREGRPTRLSAETAAHVRVKGLIYVALREAIARAGLPCEAFAEGLTVRIDRANAYEPDALVQCGAPVIERSLVAPSPNIVVEVVSPSSARFDRGTKRTGYFSLPSLNHYLIIDPEKRTVDHHFRKPDGLLDSRLVAVGVLRLEPPGMEIELAAIFPG
jgi:Uma2 family endonuclease